MTARPEELVEQLLASPPGAVKAAAILEKAGDFDPPEEARGVHQHDRDVILAELRELGLGALELGPEDSSSPALDARDLGSAATDHGLALAKRDDDDGAGIVEGVGVPPEMVGVPGNLTGTFHQVHSQPRPQPL